MSRGAESLETLRKQINARWPERNRASDGGEGDKAHQLRKSDHNPVKGVFHARDFTHDPVKGPRGKQLANAIAASKDPRVDYLISDDEIMFGAHGPHPWEWHAYQPNNPKRNRHNHHVHVSVVDDPRLAEDRREWDLSAYVDIPAAPHEVQPVRRLLKKGDTGDDVRRLQELLNDHGAHLRPDGDFGNITERALKDFQRDHGLAADGRAGPYTWEKLE